MIVVIKHKRYNTETATLIGEWGNGLGCGDFNAMTEKLYVTKKGSFFLYYWGGARTKYADAAWGGGRCEGEGIRPMDASDALSWLEKHDCIEGIEKYFADKIEDA